MVFHSAPSTSLSDERVKRQKFRKLVAFSHIAQVICISTSDHNRTSLTITKFGFPDISASVQHPVGSLMLREFRMPLRDVAGEIEGLGPDRPPKDIFLHIFVQVKTFSPSTTA
jgi:hypothetical protein